VAKSEGWEKYPAKSREGIRGKGKKYFLKDREKQQRKERKREGNNQDSLGRRTHSLKRAFPLLCNMNSPEKKKVGTPGTEEGGPTRRTRRRRIIGDGSKRIRKGIKREKKRGRGSNEKQDCR